MRAMMLMLFLVSCTCAIVFVPPAVYVVTLSIGAFLTNAMLFLAAWLAVSGLLDRKFFGKKPHELVKAALSFTGRAFVFLSCAFASVMLLSPVTPYETAVAATVSGIAGFCILFLGSFRVFLVEEGKTGKVFALAVLALLIAGGTYASIVLAQETKVISTKGAYEKKDASASAPAMADTVRELEPAGLGKPTLSVPSGYLFYPQGPQVCSIYYMGKLIKSVTPKDNCYYQDIGRTERMYCPVHIPLDDLPEAKGSLEGRGSCTEVYDIQ